MKKILLILILTLMTNLYAVDNTKYVTAPSGLRLRENPDINSKVILTIPCNEKIEIIEEKNGIVTFEKVTGKWTKIKYQKNIGWVFGGFLGNISSSRIISITSSGIGPLKMGDSFDKFVTFLKPDKTIINEDGTWTLYKNNLQMMKICDKNWGKDKVIIWADIYSSIFRLPSNIGVGDAIENFLKKFPCTEVNINYESGKSYFDLN